MLALHAGLQNIGFDGRAAPRPCALPWKATATTTLLQSIGRLFAIGYIKGLRQAVYAQLTVNSLRNNDDDHHPCRRNGPAP